jgi:hypothetical protein
MWTASPAAVRRAAQAPTHSTPPSHQQQQHLEAARRHAGADFRFTGLCVAAVTVPGRPDRAALTRTINAFLQRHDTFSSWFSMDDAGRVQRHVVDPDVIGFVPADHGWFDTPQTLREHVEAQTLGPFDWNCFSLSIVEHNRSFTLCLAVDHLHADGVSLVVALRDIGLLYGRETGHYSGSLPHPGSYLEFSEQERKYTAQLTLSSPEVQRWMEPIRGNGGRMPSFPLDLGVRGDCARTVIRTVPLFGEDRAAQFGRVCREHGARFSGGVFAVAALAERELAGADRYFGLTPLGNRTSEAELASVGWYASLVPVSFRIGARPEFGRLAARAQRALDAGKALTAVSPHRVVELAADEADLDLAPGWAAPMISYLDLRHLSSLTGVDPAALGVFSSRGASEEVFVWINRMAEETLLSVSYPQTAAADIAVDRYLTAFATAFDQAVGRDLSTV